MAYHQDIGEWHGKELVDRNGQRIGKLEDVYVDVETDEPMFGTVKSCGPSGSQDLAFKEIDPLLLRGEVVG